MKEDPEHEASHIARFINEPIGYWRNHPLAPMLLRKIVQPLVTGCTAVVKPAEQTPTSKHMLMGTDR
jgi:acyl-CoA reductase-like NAD-dependent aldehyde dehydrogenase